MDNGIVTFDFGTDEVFKYPANPISANPTDFGLVITHVCHNWETIKVLFNTGVSFEVWYTPEYFNELTKAAINEITFDLEWSFGPGDSDAVNVDIEIGK